MAPIVHEFDWPDRFVVGTVGRPGARTFYLQARAGHRVVSVSIEKEQSFALAEKIDEVLDELMAEDGNPFSIPPLADEALVDDGPLDTPIDEAFRAGAMSLGWDPSTAQVVIEAFPIIEVEVESLDELDQLQELVDAEEALPEQVMQVRIPVGAARAFTKRTRDVVASGRPICSLCGLPMDEGHVCELPDGFR